MNIARRTLRLRYTGTVLGPLVLIGLFLILVAWNGELGNFLSRGNFQTLLHEAQVPIIVGLGMLLIIVSGGIDLSVGSVVGLVSVVAIETFRRTEVDTWSPAMSSAAAIAAGLGVGALCGLVNGLAITQLRVSPFVVTLGMMSVAKGFAIWLSNRSNVGFHGARPGWVSMLQTAVAGRWLVSPGVWIAFLLTAAMFVILRFSVFGRHCYAVGSNEATARLCGISVERTKIKIYTLAGLLTGIAGVLVFAVTSGGSSERGSGLELDVIAAVVIGGASLSGGQGTVPGTVLGVLTLGVLDNGVNFSKVPVEMKYILIGSVIVASTALSQWQRRRW